MIVLIVVAVLVGVFATFAFPMMFRMLEETGSSIVAAADEYAGDLQTSGFTLPAIQRMATPQYYDSLVAGGPPALERFSLMGKLLSVSACKTLGFNVENGEGASQAKFERGDASLIFGMYMPAGGQWKVYSLAIQI